MERKKEKKLVLGSFRGATKNQDVTPETKHVPATNRCYGFTVWPCHDLEDQVFAEHSGQAREERGGKKRTSSHETKATSLAPQNRTVQTERQVQRRVSPVHPPPAWL